MLIILIVMIIAAYTTWRIARGGNVPPEIKELDGRAKRSIGGVVSAVPWLGGQSSAELMGDAPVDRIGPDEGHVYVVPPADAPGFAPPENAGGPLDEAPALQAAPASDDDDDDDDEDEDEDEDEEAAPVRAPRRRSPSAEQRASRRRALRNAAKPGGKG